MVEESMSRHEVQAALMVLLFQARKNQNRAEELVFEHCCKILALLDKSEETTDGV